MEGSTWGGARGEMSRWLATVDGFKYCDQGCTPIAKACYWLPSWSQVALHMVPPSTHLQWRLHQSLYTVALEKWQKRHRIWTRSDPSIAYAKVWQVSVAWKHLAYMISLQNCVHKWHGPSSFEWTAYWGFSTYLYKSPVFAYAWWSLLAACICRSMCFCTVGTCIYVWNGVCCVWLCACVCDKLAGKPA